MSFISLRYVTNNIFLKLDFGNKTFIFVENHVFPAITTN